MCGTGKAFGYDSVYLNTPVVKGNFRRSVTASQWDNYVTKFVQDE